MGKIVKFCGSCEEGFAEKFGFCPNCGQSLQTFEMNPVAAEASPLQEAPIKETVIAAPVAVEPVKYFEPRFIDEPVAAPPIEPEPVFEEPVMAKPIEPEPIIEDPVIEMPKVIEPIIAPAIPVSVMAESPSTATKVMKGATSTYVRKAAVDVDRKRVASAPKPNKPADDGGFYVTVIEETNAKQRGTLLLGSTFFIILVVLSATVISLFNKDIGIGAIGDDTSLASLIDEVPMTVEEEKQQKKEKDAGGGGGGGRDEKEVVTQGDLADQAKNPTRPPDAKVFRSDNFELKTPPPQTEGPPKTYDKKFDRWGDPNGRFASFSNGTGTGGGQGSGTGTGQGSGRGTGNGSGTGSGSGGGLGNGDGNGTGDGTGGIPPPPPKVTGVTQGIKIVSKPRPGYTDAARQANVQGTVILRVVFLASGQIGSVSSVKGLPNGLTEQAIAAAKRIAFEPAKNNGIPQSVTKQIEYSFSIY